MVNETPESAPTQVGAADPETGDYGPSPRVDLEPGTLIEERYRIEGRIGMGGMATVFRAQHLEIDKPVAIKVLGEELARRPALVERFMQEARAASRVRHEHIVDITDLGHVRDGLPYYAMEFLEGRTLADLMRREGRIPWPRARRIVMQLCAALQAAHERDVVHRDMKPDNVFLVERGGSPDFAKILDFGIAKILRDDRPMDLTRTGVIMGTASYMSPEQAKGQPVDPRTDVYATGSMLWEMLAGRAPFEGANVIEVLTKQMLDPLPSISEYVPDLPDGVERVLDRALRKERDERYPSAQAFLDALAALGDDGSTMVEQRPAPVPIGLATAVMAALAVAGGVAVWLWSSPPNEPPAVTAPASESDPAVTPAPAPQPEAEAPPPPKPVDRPKKRPPRAVLPELPSDDGSSDLPGLDELESDGTTPSALPSVDDPESESESEPEPEPTTGD